MLKLVFLACFIGSVVSQAPNPFGFDIPEGCDFPSLQQCVQPLMEQSAMMTRQADMSMGNFPRPNVDTVCGLMTTFKTCVMPKLGSCGRQIMTMANAAVRALNYMCVDARGETEEYYRCLGRNNDTVSQMNECVQSFMVSQMDMVSAIRSHPGNVNIWGLKTKLCSNLNNYEQCLEQKADYLCGDRAYVTKLFNLFNEGLNFLNCRNLGSPNTRNITRRPQSTQDFKDSQFGSAGHLPRMPPFVTEMQCVVSHFEKCLTPGMPDFKSPNVNQMCRFYQDSAFLCLARNLPSECKTKAEIAFRHFNEMVNYLCGEGAKDLSESMSCYVSEVPNIGRRCVSPMMSDASISFGSFLETGRVNDEIKGYLCRTESRVQNCISEHIERSCGERANHVSSRLFPMTSDMMNDLVGLDCSTNTDDPYLAQCFGPRTRHILKIVLPIVGVLLLAIIIAITVAICRRRRNRMNLRKAEDKSDLVKNDLLQQNLRFAITQTPKEKNDDSLKV